MGWTWTLFLYVVHPYGDLQWAIRVDYHCLHFYPRLHFKSGLWSLTLRGTRSSADMELTRLAASVAAEFPVSSVTQSLRSSDNFNLRIAWPERILDLSGFYRILGPDSIAIILLRLLGFITTTLAPAPFSVEVSRSIEVLLSNPSFTIWKS